MIKVVLVDDQVILRESLKFIIEQDKEIEVAGSAGNGYEALKLCEQLSPDVVLMDIMMPECNGVEGTKLIKAKYPSIKVVILTTFNDDENIANALKNGASGYVLKDVRPDELILAVKSAAKGLSIIQQQVLDTVLNQYNRNRDKADVKPKTPPVNLTEREISIIRLVADGKSNKEISSEIFITEGSVKNVITAVLEKLKLRDRTQLAVYAVKNDLL